MKNAISAVVVVLIVIILGVVGFKFFSGEKKAKPNPNAVTVRTKDNVFVQAIDKNSIFVSKDAGDTFNPDFKIITDAKSDSKVGNADILSIAFHPTDEGNLVVGTLNDGLFKKEDGSEGWDPVVFPPKNIYSFILDKEDAGNRMFASGVVSNNGRIFRSVDGGDTWKAVYSEPGQGTVVTALSQHPKDNDIIFAGTSQGTIIKSTDGGDSWMNLGNKIKGTIRDINFDSKKANVVYVLSYGSKIYYSPNAGEEWVDWEEVKKKELSDLKKSSKDSKEIQEQVKYNEEHKMPAKPIFIVADPNTSGTLYASAPSGLYRSTDFGKYWDEVNIIESAKSQLIRSVAINPEDSDEIVFIAGTSFYKSTNYGETWSVTPLNSPRNASFIVYDPFDSKHIIIGVSSISLDTPKK